MVIDDDWFKVWFSSPYYHQLYFERGEAEAAAFIGKLMARLQPATGSFMVEAGCARGRDAKILAGFGFDVTGFDISAESIQAAKIAESETLHFFQHDMRLPFWINYFNYAFSFFTSFGYFRTEREHYNAIRTLSQSLKPDGVIVLDYLNIHHAERHLVHKTEKEFDGVNYFITKWFDETHFYKKIIVEDYAREEPQTFIEKLFKFNLGDFNDMLSFHHLQIQEVFGDYDLSAFDLKNSPRMVIIAKKAVGV
ncbi:MAG: class I SAM-dependent methyltransferase [Chitinophagaceae bacterium]